MSTQRQRTITDQWGSFTAIPNEFIDHWQNLSDHARVMFVLLRRYTNGETNTAFPSYVLIQQQTGWTAKTVAKALRELENDGWLLRQRHFNAVTEYTLLKKHFPTGSSALPTGKHGTSRREVAALPVGKSIKTDIKKTDLNRQTVAEAFREIAGRDLSIHEETHLENQVPLAELESFKKFLTGWVATYGTKALFKVLAAYEQYKNSRSAFSTNPDELETVLAAFNDLQRNPASTVDIRTGGPGASSLDTDSEPMGDQHNFFTRPATQQSS